MEENQEKEFIEKTLKKQTNRIRKIFLGTCIGIAFLFILLGVVLGMLFTPFCFLLCAFALIFILFGVISYIMIPRTCTYERYKKRMENYGYPNVYESISKIDELEKKNKQMEERLQELEKNNKQ